MISPATVITLPTFSPIDLASMKLFLRIDGGELDDEIGGYVLAAVAEVERITGTRLAEQVVEIRADSFGDLAHLPVGPVHEVVSIHYRDSAGVQQLLDDDRYQLVGGGLARGIRPAFGTSWPVGSGSMAAVAVQLRVGYPEGQLPPTLDLVAKMLVRSKFEGTPFDLFAATVNDRIWL